MKTIRIKYVGRKPEEQDTQFGTGTWHQGEVKDVPAAMAPHLLYHSDVWADARSAAAQRKEPVTPAPRQPVRALDRQYEELPLANFAVMTKDQLAHYAHVNLGERIDPEKMTVAQMRSHVINGMRERA